MEISFKVPHNKLEIISEWLVDNNLLDVISFKWGTNMLTFDNEEDATAFKLKFEPYVIEAVGYFYCPYIPLIIYKNEKN